MEGLLLHEHELNVYILDERLRKMPIQKENIEKLGEKYIKKIRIDDKSLYAFECKQCYIFFNENSQNYSYFQKSQGYVYFSINKNNGKRFLGGEEMTEFFNFCGFFLIGTKNEIFSYIHQKYNSLNNSHNSIKNNYDKLLENFKKEKNKNTSLTQKLDLLSNENNEKIKKILTQVEDEKSEYKKLESKYNELEKQDKEQINVNTELKESLKLKERAIKNLTNTNKMLNSDIENLNQKLNLKENEIKAINDSLNKEKNINQKISQKLKLEQNKNKNLNDKLDNISEENNKNIKMILQELQNEKKEKDKLKSKCLELQEQGNKKNVENEQLAIENTSLTQKLDLLSNENNEKIKKILTQVENEKSEYKKLESKYNELAKQDKEQINENTELKKSLRLKERAIKNLTNTNEKLNSDVENLNQKLNLKENEIKAINDSLNEEKNVNQNISQKLKLEQNKNKKLNDKLDNISEENNKNIKMILQELQNEKKENDKLKSKCLLLQEQGNKKDVEKEQLAISLEKKDEELNDVKKNFNPENFGIKFESDKKSGDYDIIVDISSFKGLIEGGWEINYNKKEGKKKYLDKKDKPTIVVGVVGNGNKGKSFFLEKLSGYEIPKGFNVKTIGLSIRYGTTEDHNIAILDSAGQETPLLKITKENYNKKDKEEEKNGISSQNIEENENVSNKGERQGKNKEDNVLKDEKMIKNDEENIAQHKNEQKLEDEEIEFEQYSRDKLITEFFLQKFIIWKSDILILVLGSISLTEQKLLSRIKSEVKLMDKNKQIYVIHNLKDYSTEEQVNDYIENTLKKLFKIELEEITKQNLGSDKQNNNKGFDRFFVEKDRKVIHFIFVNEFSEKARYYNDPTISYIQKEIEGVKTRNTLSILNDCKNFLVKISEEIMEENFKEENLVLIEGDKTDKIVLKNLGKITLKKFVVDEMGYTLNNDSNVPKYSYYINTEDNYLYINIELPGGGTLARRIELVQGYYIFIFEGEKKGDIKIEEDNKNKEGKLLQKKNLRKGNKFKLEIKIPNSVMQILFKDNEDFSNVGELSKDDKGIVIFKCKVIILSQKNEKAKKETKIEF